MSLVRVILKHHAITRESSTCIDGEHDAYYSEKYRGRIQAWFEQYMIELHDRVNEDEIIFEYCGCQQDFDDVQSVLENRVNTTECRYTIVSNINDFVPMSSVNELLTFMSEFRAYLSEVLPDSLDDYEKILDMQASKAFEVAVIACMSSGKSTLINALLGRDLLPALNQATTAKVMRITDVDELGEKVHGKWFDANGKMLAKHDDVTKDILKEQNSDTNVADIRLETDIDWVDNLPIGYVRILDTPGPNNSQDSTHRLATMSTINATESAPDLVIYVMDVTKMEVDDDKALLEIVSDEIRKGGIAANDRFLFVLNRIDELDEDEGELVENYVEKARQYLQNVFDIQHPHIVPISALMALLERKRLNDQSMTKKQRTSYRGFQEEFEDVDVHHLVDSALCTSSLKSGYKQNVDVESEQILSAKSGVQFLEYLIVQHFEKYSLRLKLLRLYQEISSKLVGDQQMALFENQIFSLDADIDQVQQQINALQAVIEKGDVLDTIFDDLDSIKQQNQTLLVEHAQELESKCTTILSNSSFGSTDAIVSASQANRWSQAIENDFANAVTQYQSTLEQMLEQMIQNAHGRLVQKLQDHLEELFREHQIGGLTLPTISVPKGQVYLGLDERLKKLHKEREEVVIHEVEVEVERAWYNPLKWFGDSHYTTTEYEAETVIHTEIDATHAKAKIHSAMAREIRSLKKKGTKTFNNGFRSLQKELTRSNKEIATALQEKMEKVQVTLSNKEILEQERQDAKERSERLQGFQLRLQKIMSLED